MAQTPSENALKSAKAFLRDGYPFIQRGTERNHSPIFQIDLLGFKTTCIHGKEATRIFYDQEKFIRNGAVPERIQKTLMGENAIHTMDDAPHRHLKGVFLSLMLPEKNIQQLLDHMARFWKAYLGKWEKTTSTVLFEDALEIMCLTAYAWAGVPLEPTEVRKKALDNWAMVDAFGAVGPRHWRGRSARNRIENWIGDIIRNIRKGTLAATPGTAAYEIAHYRDLDGKQFSTRKAAIELINATRPIIAIAAYISFAALALHKHPDERMKLLHGSDAYTEMFVQEVRRLYPFAPFLGARARTNFKWNGHQFKKGRLVLLDVYGLLHDGQVWDNPEQFNPERFKAWDGSRYDFIPQGGGDHALGHRCPGERITIEAMKLAVNMLTRCMEYEVPEQDLSFSLQRLPTFPKSGFIITKVKKTGDFSPVASAAAKCPFHHS
ncbi:cytochrome P450 [Pontibacter sp. SGAir0037]|uniref:cytochrome P450 n=1 Tax=Pontibacter sp. SGAir0037 TaxID=2571030 RepID=UPI0010CD25E0|nr:cytochrome P450 [Pontibacter sp. SGAir0037]QCR21908.1 cytochrome P450 [Pontibacter sp. SGAir0037]